jgi:SAM-dependent methyltransferase
MTTKVLTSGLILRWLSFKEYGDQIIRLRRRVFVDEQGYETEKLSSPRDEAGLHIGAFDGAELVSMTSIHIYENEPEALGQLGLPATDGRVLQYTKRAELKEYRGRGIGELLASIAGRVAHDTLDPEYTFLVLFKGAHAKLQEHYTKWFGWQYHGTLPESLGGSVVMTIPDRLSVRSIYFKLRKMSEEGAKRLGVQIPSLIRYLERAGRMDLVSMDRLKNQNLYTAPLSIQDELPRLSAQTRLLLIEQQSRIAAVQFPPAPARLLDAGAGPGVYLSRLAQASQFQGYELVGLDRSHEMVAYARLNRPDVRWIHGSIYDTGEPSCSYDVVHANFLFIHLLNPALALMEIHRILKPGGMLYVLDVNDSTFRGPPALARLIEVHTDLCEGNRSVMNILPGLAEEHGFALTRSFSTRAQNTAPDHELTFLDDEFSLDRRTSWGLFSFLGQRDELAEEFRAAQEYYFSSKCEISICIQTHVYRKVE